MRRRYPPFSGLKSVIFGTPLTWPINFGQPWSLLQSARLEADRHHFGLLPENRPYELADRQPNSLSDSLEMVHVCPSIRSVHSFFSIYWMEIIAIPIGSTT